MEDLKSRAEAERRQLALGQRPEPRIKHRMQRAAVRALAGFFALMFVLTLVARAADGVTVARVGTDRPKTGILNQRVTVSGTIDPLGDLLMTLPGGIQVNSIKVKAGDRVKAGDTLLELDPEDLEQQRTLLREKLRILELRLAAAAAGTTSADADAVLAAEQALADAQEAQALLDGKLERTGERAAEDLEAAREEYDKALADYDRVVKRTKQDLVEAAEKEVEAAEKNLAAVQEAATAAIEAAEAGLTSAQDAQKAYSKSYYESVGQVDKLRKQLSEAEAALRELLANGADEEQIAAAQGQVEGLRASVEAAEWNMESYNYGSDLDVKRAEENLRKVTERQEAKVRDAEEELEEVKAKLEETEQREDVTDENAVVSAQSAVDAAEKAVKTAQRALEDRGVEDEETRLKPSGRWRRPSGPWIPPGTRRRSPTRRAAARRRSSAWATCRTNGSSSKASPTSRPCPTRGGFS